MEVSSTAITGGKPFSYRDVQWGKQCEPPDWKPWRCYPEGNIYCWRLRKLQKDCLKILLTFTGLLEERRQGWKERTQYSLLENKKECSSLQELSHKTHIMSNDTRALGDEQPVSSGCWTRKWVSWQWRRRQQKKCLSSMAEERIYNLTVCGKEGKYFAHKI